MHKGRQRMLTVRIECDQKRLEKSTVINYVCSNDKGWRSPARTHLADICQAP